LLGAQQHGFIDAVGFDMYSQMLSEAVARKQGKNQQIEKTSVEIDLGVDAYLPESYVSDQRQKIEIYKRIRELDSQEMLEELEADLLDRFGEYPEEVAHLLTIGQIKMDGDRALQDLVGDEGFYVYQQVYPIYGIAMTLALSGLPQFISKYVAEKKDPFDLCNNFAVDF